MIMGRLSSGLLAFRTGHSEIDAEHLRLAEIIDAVNDEIENGGGPEICKDLLQSFIEAAKSHFVNEERVLLEIGFPRLKEHCVYHNQLLTQATTVKQRCEEILESDHFQKCFEEMAKFFVDDVIRGDMDFVSFMEAKGITKR
jgi:hemerythrin-like metal-binding protein